MFTQKQPCLGKKISQREFFDQIKKIANFKSCEKFLRSDLQVRSIFEVNF